MALFQWIFFLFFSLISISLQNVAERQSSTSLWSLSTETQTTLLPTPSPTSPPDPDRNKYFHEPGGDDLLGHYDVRFFQRIVTDEERKDTLTHLIRAYFLTFEYMGVDTWIAHGTLLGWFWNSKILPWDWDLDTQVTDEGLKTLGKYYNGTQYNYDPGDGGRNRTYLLDINSWSWQRERGDGANIIDARFISVDNGLFVDITGLSEVYPDTEPGVVMCKNNHRYRQEDILPLRRAKFEGINAKIPYSYLAILEEEYTTTALVEQEFHDHHWDRGRKEWLEGPKT
jgi:hypothetical protein